jgi:hypothetical protein
MNRERFLAESGAEFPEVLLQIRPDEAGLLHCKVGAFRRATESAMDGGRLAAAEGHFRFAERALRMAGPDLRNALEVSYLEDLAFGEMPAARHQAARARMPSTLREIMVRHRPEWR